MEDFTWLLDGVTYGGLMALIFMAVKIWFIVSKKHGITSDMDQSIMELIAAAEKRSNWKGEEKSDWVVSKMIHMFKIRQSRLIANIRRKVTQLVAFSKCVNYAKVVNDGETSPRPISDPITIPSTQGDEPYVKADSIVESPEQARREIEETAPVAVQSVVEAAQAVETEESVKTVTNEPDGVPEPIILSE